MPLYQYCCQNPQCAHEYEERRESARALEAGVCPQCGAPTKKVFCPQQIQVMIPERFQHHVHTTGMKSELGAGPGMDLANASKFHGTTHLRAEGGKITRLV